MATDQDIRKLKEYLSIDEQEARFIAAVGEGEIEGDILAVEDAEKADELVPPADD